MASEMVTRFDCLEDAEGSVLDSVGDWSEGLDEIRA
jgi:hypothetical protein